MHLQQYEAVILTAEQIDPVVIKGKPYKTVDVKAFTI